MPSNTKHVTSPIVVVLTIVAVCLSALAVIISVTGLFFNTNVDVRVGDSAINEAVKYAELYEDESTEFFNDDIYFVVPDDITVSCTPGNCILSSTNEDSASSPDMFIRYSDYEVHFSTWEGIQYDLPYMNDLIESFTFVE